MNQSTLSIRATVAGETVAGVETEMLDRIRVLAREAGEEILRFYADGAAVMEKADASPLTEADLAAHRLIVRRLGEWDPLTPVVSEEGDPPAGGAARRFWLVDPLDGTKEFIKRTGEFTVNIALVDDGRPVLGVVHAPAAGLTYFASTGAGAWRQAGDGEPEPLRVRPCPASGVLVVASRDHAGPLVRAFVSRLDQPGFRSMGSSLKFCLVAAGEADFYLRDVPTMEWDTAAAQCVVEQAGGRVCTLDGTPLTYGKPTLKNPSLMTCGDFILPWTSMLEGTQAGGDR